MDAKRQAAVAALESEVRNGMTLGLGTGSTAEHFIDALGEALRTGKLRDVRGVATSAATDRRARQLGIPIVELISDMRIDLTVDGADEIAPNLDLIKGLGGALLREKVVAQNSSRVLIIADASKLVQMLGTRGPLPVEVANFAHQTHEAFFRSLGCEPALRLDGEGKPFVTDNGNHIYDCRFRHIDVPGALETALRKRAGVVETGLFLAVAHTAIIGYAERVEILNR